MNTHTPPWRRWRAALALATLLTLLTVPAARAADANPPGKMTFQGFLTDAGNPPVPLGNASPENKAVTFKIYRSATGTAGADVVWAESQVVTVDKGHFSVLLGEGSSVSGLTHSADLSGVFVGADASERWIGITLDGAEITPRIQFFAAPYAQLARVANTLASGATIGAVTANGDMASTGTLRGAGLEISGASSFGASVTATGSLTSSGVIAGLIFNDRAEGNSAWQWYSTGGTARLWNGADRLAITSGGNIGIGTLTPSTRLQIGEGVNEGIGGLLINTGWIDGNNPSISPLEAQVRGDTKFIVNSVGRVGVGTRSPVSLLHVRGDGAAITVGNAANADGALYLGNSGHGLKRSYPGAGNNNVGLYTTAGDVYLSGNGTSTSHLVVKNSGRVGIGTSDPQAPLDVNGAANHVKSYGYLNRTAPTGIAHTGVNAPYSILASHYIGAAEINAFSDARIKKVVALSDNVRDLETIQKLRVTDYQMVDEVTEGKEVKKGFIAQEVEAIIPEAVSSAPRFVPDIYSHPASLKFNDQGKTLAVTLPKEHGLKAGDLVRIIADEARMDLTVTNVPSATEFVVGNVEKGPEQIFVFGKHVSDFRILNYDRIFTTGISAIQELDRQVQALKKSEARIAALEAKAGKLAELEQKASRVDSLEREVAGLKALVAQLAQQSTGPNPASNLAAAAR